MKAYTTEEYNSLLKKNGFPLVKQPDSAFADNNIFEAFPLLYRGCHVAEIETNVDLQNIQGRPEDKSYNGNILHFTQSFNKAYSYAKTNITRQQFPDKRVCIVAYDSKLLFECGTYGPDYGEGKSITFKESIEKYQQLRWYPKENIKNISDISHCISFVVYEGKCYKLIEDIPRIYVENNKFPNEENYILYNRKTEMQTLLQHKNGRLYRYESRLYFRIRDSVENAIFDSNHHKVLQIGSYFYESIGDFILYKTHEKGYQWEIDCPESMLVDVLHHECDGKYISLVNRTYPIKIR